MKVLNRNQAHKVECPRGGFTSQRMLLKSDGMGFTVTHTTVHPEAGTQTWHYTNHMEACYCVRGEGILKDIETGEAHLIKPGMLYALDKHDRHEFTAIETTELVCVFNPPLKGDEVHGDDGTYSI